MTTDAPPGAVEGLARGDLRVDRLFGAIAIACGGVLLVSSAVWLAWTSSWIASTEVAQGVVVAHRNPPRARSSRAQRAASFAETVRFTDAAGVEREFVSRLSTSSPFPVGGAVPVRYRTADPSDASIDTWFRLWGLPAIFMGGGAVFAAAGIAFRRRGGARTGAGRP